MKKERIKILAVLAGAILFNFIFWQEKLALNTILYDTFLLTTLFIFYPEARRVSTVRWLTLGHLICLAMIIIHNSVLSKLGFLVTLSLLIGFIEYIHRSAWYAGGSMLLNGIFASASFIDSFPAPSKKKRVAKPYGKFIRLAIIPIILAVIFYFIYSSANSVFSELVSSLGESINKTFSDIFALMSWQRLLFLVAGLYLTAWLILRCKLNFFENKEKKCEDELKRKRKTIHEKRKDPLHNLSEGVMGKLANGTMGLKNMNTVGLISLVVLNLMLLIINIIDVTYIWFGFEYTRDVDLYKIIHQGTDLLIISILLAIAVLIIFFRGNLNFYRNNKWLKYGAYAWIIQNCILVVSVLLRDYYYINLTGLAYKRIGVLFYLLLVLIGLASVFWKIYRKKTTYYLFRVNAWAVIIVLIGSTIVNWDEAIASYNIKRKDKIFMPVEYMLTLSNKAIPILDQNTAVLKEQLKKQSELGFISMPCYNCVDDILKKRKEEFAVDQKKYTWLSYNLADAAVQRYLKERTKLSAK